ncbi:MAG: tRNA uridine-5-carboxymethylaminomethyl(34) synthesis GTPase MnmE [Bacteroidales bacterium]|nr:tRNA uridine-5-carboxymethylaminomethyl(34) synthesis GTPase MnmE [Bacteroidales bacterium]
MTAFNTDTIVAISTPHGMGGIAVVRVSGAQATTIVAKRWKGAPISEMKTHTAHLGHILDSQGQLLDEVVLTLFRGPRSFTGEDVVEIACHGSIWIQQQVVNTLIDAGCRAATGGEFTQRAFVNGRLDLSQAEAIADVIASSSRASHRVAMNQMRGAFSRRLSSLRAQLLQFVSLIELELDFSEEEVNFADRARLITLATDIKTVIYSLADSYSAGNAIKNGIPVAIVGQTNAGKSTLLNALLGDDRALVSDIKGTTRDVIEDTITLGGTLFRFIDTAGIRQSDDIIETMGIERSFKKLDEAQLVLWVVDPSEGAQEIADFSQQILPRCKGKKVLVVVNKIDTATAQAQQSVSAAISAHIPSGVEARTIFISARDGQGLDTLQSTIIEMAALPSVADDEAVIVTNARHYQALVRAGEAITRSLEGLNAGISGDLVSQDIRECMHYLGEITGEISPDDILGEIFTHFCIGK